MQAVVQAVASRRVTNGVVIVNGFNRYVTTPPPPPACPRARTRKRNSMSQNHRDAAGRVCGFAVDNEEGDDDTPVCCLSDGYRAQQLQEAQACC